MSLYFKLRFLKSSESVFQEHLDCVQEYDMYSLTLLCIAKLRQCYCFMSPGYRL